MLRKRKKKKKLREAGIRTDTLESSDEFREEVYQNPTDLRVLNAAIREADELRKNEEIEKAVVTSFLVIVNMAKTRKKNNKITLPKKIGGVRKYVEP